ncbi:hypothetical protein ACWT_4115 [Actinoplanes sp. SE50]|uniref:hypothetical protein n=1 Tax=unclassified Actinoplanes TaxID=2626549 RepID=UPI00023EBF34|nr:MULTISPECIES: hypothetical protein [unclassified Actinoplanes]AEV85139.1 hypothetical protein ACPL_4244 [Actinoplanes sp. SE50/110]ATO83530.1 hypothetical protein ACWT_4115 [Actinoplanes sp. SE50]SLM00937.1 hypothetical protein ACSP50_4170 [Actinoplanes sp. SE50/110]
MSEPETVAGGSTDQHVSGLPETGDFLTDAPPTSGTPADGSSNAGINRTGANRPAAATADAEEMDDLTDR